MKLIKINPDHFVVVNDFYKTKKDIKQEDANSFFYHEKEGVVFVNRIGDVSFFCNDIMIEFFYACLRKITHSTQPLDGVELISLSDMKELIGEVDVENIAEKTADALDWDFEDPCGSGYSDFIDGFVNGYNQCLQDNKEKKYTDEDVINIVKKSRETGLSAEYLLLRLQHKTEWDVEFVDNKIKLI